MSLDVIKFHVEDFIYKYEKLQWSSIDVPLRKLFREYYAHLKDIDIASLQGADPDLLYFLNCAVDDCLVEPAESLHSMAKRSFKGCRQRKGLDIKKLEKNLTDLKSTISSQCGSFVSVPHKPASIPLLNYKLHGFDKQFDQIVEKISSRSNQGISEPYMRAVGVVGVGGSGKTTLASMVFNSREVREKYQIMIWASLTVTLNRKESTRGSVFREILSGVQNNDSLKTMLQKIKYHQGGRKMADHVLDMSVEHFKEALKRNSGKYLIVLDDVWETDYWFAENEAQKVGETKCILSRQWIQETGGTIVVTSRLEEMAENIVGKRDLHMILPVSDEACFDIFLDRATKDGYFEREDEQLLKRRRDVESKCFGLPLAACTVADIIVAKHRKETEEPARKEKADAKRKAEAANDKAEVEGEASVDKDTTGAEGKSDVSEKKLDALKPKAETEGEADGSKPKVEAEGEEEEEEEDAINPKAEAKSEGEADSSEPKIEAEGETDALKATADSGAAAAKLKAESAAAEIKAESAAAEIEAEVAPAESKTEAAAVDAKAEGTAVEAKEGAEAKVKEVAPDSKAEEQAGTEADVSKAKTGVALPLDKVADVGPPDGALDDGLKKDEVDKKEDK